MNDPDPEIFDMLILNGAIEVAGIDPTTNEFLYSMTEKMIEILPDVYEEHMKEVNNQIMTLWQDGFLNVDLFDSNPLVTLTDKAFDVEELNRMAIESYECLNEIKRVLAK
jgi:predicted transcriptional regulator